MAADLGLVLSFVPAVLAAGLFDMMCARRGLLPPAFRLEPGAEPSAGPVLRRIAAFGFLALMLWVGVFSQLALGGSGGADVAPGEINPANLFLGHMLLLGTAVAWYVLGYVRPGAPPRPEASFAVQFGLRARRPGAELGIGLVAGLAAWIAVLGAMVALALGMQAFGGEALLPDGPPTMVAWLAALPVGLRLAVSLSAGVVEEIFFRGFLQPRAGIVLSSLLFALAHAGYGQPLMLVGILLLSLVFAGLTWWRQSVWAAVVAHALYDIIQLLILIPGSMRLLGGE